MMTLYDCATAPSPRRARIFLAEKGVRHDTVSVDLSRREQLGDAYRAINPLCTVPALRLEDGQVLSDNAAIAAYLEARFEHPPLMGVSPWERAQIASWNWRAEFEGLMAIAEAMRNTAPSMAQRALPGPIDYAQIAQLGARGLARLGAFFDTLDVQLAGRETLAGDGFSVADITAFVAVEFARVVRVRPTPAHPNLLRWRNAMAQRPSMVA
jgi:glutathione S-transferase